MPIQNATRLAADLANEPRGNDHAGERDGSSDSNLTNKTQAPRTSKWRETYKVHPAADVFPPMSDDELAELGQDIKANGLREPVEFIGDELIDGRNRLEAMERAGLGKGFYSETHLPAVDPVAHVISKNIRRRHLTKQQQADLIVAALKAGEAPRQDGEMPKRHVKGKAGSQKDAFKAKAIKAAKATPDGPSNRAIERAIAKSEGKTDRYTPRPRPKPKSGKPIVGLEAARRHYLDCCASDDVDLDVEMAIIAEALRDNPKRPEPDQSPPDIEVQQKLLLRVYQQSLPVVRRWFRVKLGAEQ
jgi:hypothetical protein